MRVSFLAFCGYFRTQCFRYLHDQKSNLLKTFIDEFKNANLYNECFQKLVHINCKNGQFNSQQTDTFNIVNLLCLTDNFGTFEKDLLFGHMKIYLKTIKDTNFPKYWKTTETEV